MLSQLHVYIEDCYITLSSKSFVLFFVQRGVTLCALTTSTAPLCTPSPLNPFILRARSQ